MPIESIPDTVHDEAQYESWSELLNAGMILRYTRHWIHYGSISFVVVCSIVAALRGLAGQ